MLRLRAALGRLDPALVVAHGGEPLKFLVPAMAGRRRPLAYYAIGTLADQAHRPARKILWQTLARRPDVVACEGQEVLDECAEVLGVPRDRLVLAPNGRDPERFRPRADAPPRAAPVVTFVGALTTGKRPDRFVALVAELRDRGVPMEARLVGDGPLRAELAGPAARAGVQLLGVRNDVDALLRESDLFVFPSSPRGEGMPGVLIEAGLSGLPIVATDVPGVRSVIVDGETGVVVPPDDLGALVTAAATLISDPARRVAMGHAARVRCADHFSLDLVTDIWRGFLLPLLAGTRRAA
jgi:glycosyltransferase involved in cell wall biosynthesis